MVIGDKDRRASLSKGRSHSPADGACSVYYCCLIFEDILHIVNSFRSRGRSDHIWGDHTPKCVTDRSSIVTPAPSACEPVETLLGCKRADELVNSSFWKHTKRKDVFSERQRGVHPHACMQRPSAASWERKKGHDHLARPAGVVKNTRAYFNSHSHAPHTVSSSPAAVHFHGEWC